MYNDGLSILIHLYKYDTCAFHDRRQAMCCKEIASARTAPHGPICWLVRRLIALYCMYMTHRCSVNKIIGGGVYIIKLLKYAKTNYASIFYLRIYIIMYVHVLYSYSDIKYKIKWRKLYKWMYSYNFTIKNNILKIKIIHLISSNLVMLFWIILYIFFIKTTITLIS